MKRLWAYMALVVFVSAASIPETGWAQTAGQTTEVAVVKEITPDSLRGKQTGFMSLAVKNQRVIVAGTAYRFIQLSLDGGLTWDERNWLNAGVYAPFGEIYAALAARNGSFFVGTEAAICKSTDDGRSWRTVWTWGKDTIRIFCLLEVRDTIWAGGDGILRSIDGGETWTVMANRSTTYPYVGGMAALLGRAMLVGIESAYSSTARGVMKSTDQGATWNFMNAGLTNKNIVSLATFPSLFSRTVYASTYDGGVFVSTDEGSSWKPETGLPIRYGGPVFIGSVLGVFAGDAHGSGLYRLLGGAWQKIEGFEGHFILSITEFSLSQLLVGTHRGIFLVTFPNPTFVEGQGTPETFQLSQNYPNPFNPSTCIVYRVAQSAQVRLAVYNIFGIEIAVLVEERKSPGAYTVRFDGSRLPSGIYFYRLETSDGFKAAKKMLLVK
ncbi:MAG: T9SS type A sorting domain-containing protein [Candidatus Jorgensenbacteria bacterium]